VLDKKKIRRKDAIGIPIILFLQTTSTHLEDILPYTDL
jgi:hypothetical protein